MSDIEETTKAEITPKYISIIGNFIAGVLLILFTIIPIYFIIGYWPDKLPAPNSQYNIYSHKLFHVESMR
jgi:hypothetical protein